MLTIIDCHYQDKLFCESVIKKMPFSFGRTLSKRYSHVLLRQGRRTANLMLLEYSEKIDLLNNKSILTLFDYEYRILELARACADRCIDLVNDCAEIKEIKDFMVQCAIVPPNLKKDKSNIEGFINRIKSDQWWSKKLAKKKHQLEEEFHIQVGLVRSGQGGYVSNQALTHYIESQKQSRKYLESMKMVNEDTGEEIPLIEIFNASLANTENRKIELMVRAGGLDYCAQKAGHEADFYTVTCPSEFHSTIKKTQKPNPKYKGYTPKQASDHLVNNWSKIRSAFDYAGIQVYGVRVSEPHHDACPHWHFVLWGTRAHLNDAKAIIEAESILYDKLPMSDIEKRVKVIKVDYEKYKGGAVGYLAKYISKNLVGIKTEDGYIGLDDETGKSTVETSVRVRAWSSLWGIRQFQFFGSIPAGLWRELRRLSNIEDISGLMGELSALAKGKEKGKKKEDYGLFIEKIGGVLVKKQNLKLLIIKEKQLGVNKWGDSNPEKVIGLMLNEDNQCLQDIRTATLKACDLNDEYRAESLLCDFIDFKKAFEFKTHTEKWSIKKIEVVQVEDVSLDFAVDLTWIHLNNCRNLNESEIIEKPPPITGKTQNGRITI